MSPIDGHLRPRNELEKPVTTRKPRREYNRMLYLVFTMMSSLLVSQELVARQGRFERGFASSFTFRNCSTELTEDSRPAAYPMIKVAILEIAVSPQ